MPVLWMGRGSISADSAGLWACLRCAYIVQYDHKLYKKTTGVVCGHFTGVG